MTDEDDSNSTGLMREFSVSLIALAIIEVWFVLTNRGSRVHQSHHTELPVYLTTRTKTDSETFSHVRFYYDKNLRIICWNYSLSDDNSRVCLNEITGEIGSDYINASFITVRIMPPFSPANDFFSNF